MTEPIATATRRFATRVVSLRPLSATGFELTLERGGLAFRAGQLVNIHGRDVFEDRSYTVCSGERDDSIQVLFRLIPEGKLTPQLASLRPGDPLAVSGPYGEFTVRDTTRKIVFIATGTGIAPCRAYQRTHPGLDMAILHGVRRYEDLFYREELAGAAYHPCVSCEDGPGFRGRVTDYLRKFGCDPSAHFYLCGANEMFYDARDVLEACGVPAASIFTEAYYYRSDA
jgi:NAD(P)H-flavin reductase